MSETKDDGGAAFPEAVAVGPSGDVYGGASGMSLRDWFAGMALSQLVSLAAEDGWFDDAKKGAASALLIAMASYNVADAMVAARAKEAKP